MKSNSLAVCSFTPKHLGWGPFQTSVDAALWRGSNDAVYLFSGDEYIRYTDVGDGRDDGYPRRIKGAWIGIPASFQSNIDAALWRESNGKIYLFKGSQYVRLEGSNATMDAGYPQPIAGNWNGLPASFTSGIDAAFWRESNNKIYFFKGNQYARLDTATATMDAGVPEAHRRELARAAGVVHRRHRRSTHAPRQQQDLLLPRQAVRAARRGDVGDGSGYPNWIDKNWMPFPR